MKKVSRLRFGLVLLFGIFCLSGAVLDNLIDFTKYEMKSKAIHKYYSQFIWFHYLAGLNQHYSMYSYLHRGEYFLRFSAKVDGEWKILPLPHQSDRTWYEFWFLDHRTGKFHSNLWNHRQARYSYLDYLCREFSGMKASFMRSQFVGRPFLERPESLMQGTHWANKPEEILGEDVYSCPNY